jgi:hypothetical protein
VGYAVESLPEAKRLISRALQAAFSRFAHFARALEKLITLALEGAIPAAPTVEPNSGGSELAWLARGIAMVRGGR